MHVMFYGPPGTGKTMVAQRFAEYSGLEYAIMSGGDVAPLEEQAVTELHKLFKWVHRSRRGVLLFIDEADAFLSSRKRGNMSESLRNALTTMLYHTGTPSSQFMMVLATNRPHDLDNAILDRIDESVEFGLPDLDARQDLVKLYFKTYITKPLKIKPLRPEDLLNGKGQEAVVLSPAGRKSPKALEAPKREDLVDEEALAEVSRRLKGFSGREISKLMTSLQTHVLYSERKAARRKKTSHFLEKAKLFEVVDQKVQEHQRTCDFQVAGYDYQVEMSQNASNILRSVSPKGGGGLLGTPTKSKIDTAA
jgi:ATPase family AAA domain-containing protein 3A/B